MKYRLSVIALAEQDLQWATEGYEAERAGLGGEFHDAVALVLRNLQQNPCLYPVSDIPGVRKAVIGRFPYCIYYEPINDLIIVYAVHDCWRDPGRWRGRTR